MNATTISLIAGGIPSILAAITALVVALKAHGKATDTDNTVRAHIKMEKYSPDVTPLDSIERTS